MTALIYAKTPNIATRLLQAVLAATLLPALLHAETAPLPSSPRERILLNEDWLFTKDDPADAGDLLHYDKIKPWLLTVGTEFRKNTPSPADPPAPTFDISYLKPGFNDTGWRKLNLPHDWAIEGPFKLEYPGETGKLPYWGIGWYRKHWTVPAADHGKRLCLQIDGAMSYSTVWLNGHLVGGWPYGYASYEVNLTPYVDFSGPNLLAIRLDNPNDSSRWYPGAGIYRNVWLVKTAPVHVAHWGTCVTTPEASQAGATVHIKTTVTNESGSPANVTVRTALFENGPDGKPTGTPALTMPSASLTLDANKSNNIEAESKIDAPKLWSSAAPNLYTAVTTVEQSGAILDTYATPFGIRSIKFDLEKGFLLNGSPLKLNGVCLHHDLGALGAAFNLRAMEHQLELLREMGCNAVRTSHNPPAPEFLDLCDRMGFLVMEDTFDCWATGKKPNDYHLLWKDWHEADLRAAIRRDRNHPCIVMWDVGNEVVEQLKPEGPAISAELVKIVHEEDPTRPATIAANQVASGYNGFQTPFDVFGYNYNPFGYEKFLQKNPKSPLNGSETASAISSRGEYFFPKDDANFLKGFNDPRGGKGYYQMTSYDLSGVQPPDDDLAAQVRCPFVSGQFVWTGFDYLGEPFPYSSDATNLLNTTDPEQQEKIRRDLEAAGKLTPSRSSYFGILDLAGFKKDRFYIYQAAWRPELPMAHILPHWNWPDRVGMTTPVHVYTSADEAELFLNGQSLGRKKREIGHFRLRWDDVKYQPGELKVVAYKNGNEWATDTVKTTGAPAKLVLSMDRNALRADGEDLAYVTATVEDADGLPVPHSSNLVHFEISGPAEIVATDNGDATNLEPFQSKDRKAFNGLCLAIVRTHRGEAGPITVKATSSDLAEASAPLSSQ